MILIDGIEGKIRSKSANLRQRKVAADSQINCPNVDLGVRTGFLKAPANSIRKIGTTPTARHDDPPDRK